MTVFLDKFGIIVDKENSSYEILLTGSYRYSFLLKMYVYDVKYITPKMPIIEVYSSKIIEE